ncbi:hypothetical protein SLS53_008169 [Cytospora paraplurivora]|uniref:Uncharacterized protein n=1 Tax=Cytospora paraplurivora TaxID=2898453 RepID=A0AAN9U129_9PEZI
MKMTQRQWDETLKVALLLVVVVCAPAFAAQRLWYQLVMLLYPAGSAVHAASHTPAVVDEKAVSLVSEQKQAS